MKIARKTFAMACLIALAAMGTVSAFADPHPNNGPTTVIGTSGDDVLSGNHGPDVLIGKAGDDRLWGGKGPDTFKCGAGYDVAHNIRDTGNDTFSGCEVVKTT